MNNVQQKIEIGTKLFCNWGAMYPTETGVVTEIDGDWVTYETHEAFRKSYIPSIKEKQEHNEIGVFII